MRTLSVRLRLVALVLLSIVPLAFTHAVGQAESSDQVLEDQDHEHATGVPHIEPIEADGTLALVATTNIVGDVLANVIGDLAAVTVMIGNGENPHSYEPAPRALRVLERAHIVFTNGLALEENLLDDVDAIATDTWFQ